MIHKNILYLINMQHTIQVQIPCVDHFDCSRKQVRIVEIRHGIVLTMVLRHTGFLERIPFGQKVADHVEEGFIDIAGTTDMIQIAKHAHLLDQQTTKTVHNLGRLFGHFIKPGAQFRNVVLFRVVLITHRLNKLLIN